MATTARMTLPPALVEAADGGDAEAQAALGDCYLKGRGVERNPELGVSWLRRATDQRFGPSHYLLARCYATGVGVGKDVRRAVKHYRASAAAGFPPAVTRMKVLTTCAACGAENTHRTCAGCVCVSFCDAQCQSRCRPHPHQARCQKLVRVQEASLGVDQGEKQH
jgi:TPR repeat protein